MQYKLLGKSGLRVSEMALGTMTFGEDWGWGASKDESRRMFEAFCSAGGNFIDTACNYTEGSSERLVGEFIAADRDYFVVATKYSLRPNRANPMDPNAGGNHLKNLRRSVESSLKRLKTEYIDLLYLHMWDYTTPIEEVMNGLNDLVRAGKVLYIGFSDSPAYIIAKANLLADLRGLARVVAMQLPYGPTNRDPERELLPLAREDDIAVTAWGILNGGVLTGKYRDPQAVKRYDGVSEKALEIGDRAQMIAAEIGCTPAQAAIRWVMQQPGTQIIPVLGARTAAQLEENLGALDVSLSQAQVEALGGLRDFQLGFPRAFLHDDEVLGLLHGKTYWLLDNHRPG